MQDTQAFKLADGVTFESVDDGAVVLVFDNGQLYSCNDTSAAFLNAIDGQRTLSDVAVVIAQEFDAPVAEILADLRDLASEMQSEGIIAAVR
jgi:pyrroloquinoline quinone biosynthesis protein D